MTANGPGAELGRAAVESMVAAIDENWTVREVSEIDEGGNETFRVAVETPTGTRECVLKTSTGGGGTLDAEARLLRLLASEASVPVPEVYGVVDEHPDLPAPFFLMAHREGDHLPGDPSELPVGELSAYAREVGRYLGRVHALDAFDGFGPIVAARDVDPADRGGTRPLAREYDLTIPDPHDEWASTLTATVDAILDRHSEGRFGDLTPRIRDAVEERRAGLDLSGSPVIARLDHGLHNLLVDRADEAVAGVLDWGIARATHPEYDLACAEQGFCTTAPLDSDRRRRVRAALYDGYREINDLATDESFDARRRLYLLVFQTISMNWAEGWITTDIAEEVERDNRRFVAELL